MTEVAMGGPEALLPTQNTSFTRGVTELEPRLMRGHDISPSIPGILYHVARDPEIIDPHTGEHAIVAVAVADPRFKKE